jgi:hypothetical protein
MTHVLHDTKAYQVMHQVPSNSLTSCLGTSPQGDIGSSNINGGYMRDGMVQCSSRISLIFSVTSIVFFLVNFNSK